MNGCMTRKRTRLEISNPTAQNFDLLYFLMSGRAGVVIGHDSKSCGLCPRRFEPVAHDMIFFIFFSSLLEISNPTAQNFDLLYFLMSGRAGVVIVHD